jgi:hypothetical protein
MCYGTKGSFLKQRGDVQEEELKVGRKPNLENWGTEPTDKEGFAYRIKRAIIRQNISTFKGIILIFLTECIMPL